MSQNIIFLGGIHGVGKTTYSDFIKQHIPSIELLSCSHVLRWKDPKEKEVANVNENQNRLVSNLSKIVSPDKHYLLDGHFCLRNTNGEIEPIEIETFRAIAPAMIILLEEDSSVIQERLQKRDGKIYSIDELEEFAKKEKEQASLIAKELNVPLFCVLSSKPETHLREIVSFCLQDIEPFIKIASIDYSNGIYRGALANFVARKYGIALNEANKAINTLASLKIITIDSKDNVTI